MLLNSDGMVLDVLTVEERIPKECSPLLDKLIFLDGDFFVLVSHRSDQSNIDSFSRVEVIQEGQEIKLEEEENIVGMVDLRNIVSDHEKVRVLWGLRHWEFQDVRQKACSYSTLDKRDEIVRKIVRSAEQLPNILRVYAAGSFAYGGGERGSDADIFVLRDHCPGYDSCGTMLANGKGVKVDIFCVDRYEFQLVCKKRLAILIGAHEIYSKDTQT
jgi:hypothetical protein